MTSVDRVARDPGLLGPDTFLERYVERQSVNGEPPPPSLADIWRNSLGSFLDPDPFILRPSDAGMGRDLDRLLGGGLTPGQTASIVSLGAGVGKTALVHQFADHVAEASAESYLRGLEQDVRPAVVPVVFVSEMTVRDLTLRSFARQTGVEGYLLRDPQGPKGCRPLADGLTEGEGALVRAEAAAKGFEDAARFLTPIDRRTRVTIPELEEAVRRVRAHWRREGAVVPAVLVVVDPVHWLLDPARSEVEGIAQALQGLLDLAREPTQS